MDNNNEKSNSALKYITPAVAVALIAGAAIWMNNKPAAAPAEQTPATPSNTTGEQAVTPPATTPETPVASTAKYKAGSYTAIGDYQSPGGHDQIGLTVTIDEAGVIKDAKTEEKPSNPASKKWQERFTAGFGGPTAMVKTPFT